MGRPTHRVRAVLFFGTLGAFNAACGAGNSPVGPTSLVPAYPGTPGVLTALVPESVAVVDGTVTGNPSVTAVDRVPQAGVLIEVLVGDVVTESTTTDDNGVFHLRVAPGEIRLRASKAGYATSITGPMVVDGGGRTLRHLRIEPRYFPPSLITPQRVARVVRGRVTDALGKGVASALVTVSDSATRMGFASVAANADGEFSVTFFVPAERMAAVVHVSRSGYPSQQVAFDCCVSAEPAVVHVMMPIRVVAVRLVGPSILGVGETAVVMASVTFDDGTEILMNPVLFDRAGGVENSARGSGMIVAARAGGGWISWSHQGVYASLTIAIPPNSSF